MTILITGVTGLVGGRLLPRLIDAGMNCSALVRPGKTAPAGVAATEGDILDPSSIEAAVTGLTAVVHLAAVFRTKDDDVIWKSNFDGARNLIEAVKAHSPNARFILASTGHVYNRDQPRPGRESDQVNPTHPYPASKIAAENALRESGLNWSVLRFPFVYGDGDGHIAALPQHVGEWHPAQRMSVIHHRDIATAVMLALQGIMDGQIVNITDDVAPSVYELIQLINGEIKSSNEPLSDPWYLQIDGSLARSLGFKPTVRTIRHAAQEALL